MTRFLYSAEQVRELDRCAIEDFGIPSYELMCNAGQVLLDIVQLRYSEARRVLIVCGSGNNAGDGYVLARLLGANVQVDVYSAFDLEKLSGDARRAWRDYVASSSRPVLCSLELARLGDYDLIVDALFGSGLSRDVEGHCRSLIKAINALDRPVLAVDVPSGLNATTGAICGVAIKATVTATFIGQKRGLLTQHGPDCSGQLLLDELGVPGAVFDTVQSSVRLLDRSCLGFLPARLKNTHKGSYGSVVLLGANHGMEGAIALAGRACLRAGAGLAKVAGRSGIVPMQASPDLIRADVSDSSRLKPLTQNATVLAAGPGLGVDDWAKECLTTVLQSRIPVVLDADALNLLAEDKMPLSVAAVLTPHPAEAGRLLGCSTQEIQTDRFSAAVKLARRYQAVVVLKGCGTLVSDGESVFLCGGGNPSMACAGMGDVLTGVVSALLAQGLTPLQAANAGVYLHALAGDLAHADYNAGLMASDVVDYLPKALEP